MNGTLLRVRIPDDKTTWADRVGFLLALREKLRREHNSKGADRRAGRLTADEWDQYLEGEFRPRSLAISEALSGLKLDPPQTVLDEIDTDQSFEQADGN